MSEAWDADPLQVHDYLAGLGVPELQEEVLADLAVLPLDAALGRQAVVVVGVEGLHHRAIGHAGQVLLGDLDKVEDAELRVAHAVVLGESIMVEDINLNRERPVCDGEGELLVPFWVDGLIFDAGLHFLLSEVDDDVGVAAVGERVADCQVEPAHHLHLEQAEQALHGWIDEVRTAEGGQPGEEKKTDGRRQREGARSLRHEWRKQGESLKLGRRIRRACGGR